MEEGSRMRKAFEGEPFAQPLWPVEVEEVVAQRWLMPSRATSLRWKWKPRER